MLMSHVRVFPAHALEGGVVLLALCLACGSKFASDAAPGASGGAGEGGEGSGGEAQGGRNGGGGESGASSEGGSSGDGSSGSGGDSGGAGDSQGGSSMGGSASGGSAGTSDAGAAGACGRPKSSWATWPMPNPPSTGLPNPASYDTSVDGVVCDEVTGLLWQREVDSTAVYIRSEASAYCDGLELAGYDDWRLPTRIELV